MTEDELLDEIESDDFSLAKLFEEDYDLDLREIAMIEAAFDEELFKVNRNIGIEEED